MSTHVVHLLTSVALTKGTVISTLTAVVDFCVALIIVSHLFHLTLIAVNQVTSTFSFRYRIPIHVKEKGFKSHGSFMQT